jgi:hypothetical protein
MSNLKSIVITLSIILIVIWVSPIKEMLFAVSEKVMPATGENHALLIGISNYKKWPDLKSPSRDANEIAKILLNKYDFKKKNVVLLTDKTKEKPTRITILTYLEKFTSELTEKDNLLVFFVGHGTEDERGETYWIPQDGAKKTKLTWLKHSELLREYFASEYFKAKNVCIITDTVFSSKLIKPKFIPISPYDLRYPEKIKEMALRRSREIIAFGDAHWPASKRTEGFGLFTYYFRKALKENWLKIIDFENLIFDEKTIFNISKIAGTQILCGRFRKCPMESGGQAIITRVISPPVINILSSNVIPKKGYLDDTFYIEAKTSSPAYEVYVDIGGKKFPMRGSGTKWKHSIKVASLGLTRFKITARNEDFIEGTSGKGQINAVEKPADIVNVTSADVNPKKALAGDMYRFKAVTDTPASKVSLIIAGKHFEMHGSDTHWVIDKKIDSIGTVDFSIIAENKEGIEGRSRSGILVASAPITNIVYARAAPGTGYAGETFLLTAKTDRPADAVFLKMDGVTYSMKGAGRDWKLRKEIPGIGKKQFTVIAKNIEGVAGLSKQGIILTKKKPLAIPDVASIALSPKILYAGENIMIKAKTTSPADEVFIEIQGKRYTMEGSGTGWKYLAKIDSIGTRSYRVIAQNKEGEQGLDRKGTITTLKRFVKSVDIVTAEVFPKEGYENQEYTFKATTNLTPESVIAVIGKKRYKMVGSGTDWVLKKKISDTGPIDFYLIATNNKGVEGISKDGSFLVKASLVNVVDAKAAPGTGYAGETFLLTAKTDRPADTVFLKMDGITYPMEGSGRDWNFKKEVPDIGKKQFTVIAKNIEGVPGLSKQGIILTKKKALAIPDVLASSVNVVSPGKGYAGDSFVIEARTSAPADEVVVEIDGKKYVMEGTGTEWKYITEIAAIGTSTYRVMAKNKEGGQGLAKEGKIITTKRPARLVNIARVEISPGKGYRGSKFTFKAVTDTPAARVFLIIGENRYKMKGSGTTWSLTKKIEESGTLLCSMVAGNEEKVEGGAKAAEFTVEEIIKRYVYNEDGTITDKVTGDVKKRFIDNGDGTITDLITNLMLLKKPKQIAQKWEAASTYCRELEYKGYTGWRLPTADEWKNLIDAKQRNPSLPPGHPFSGVLTHAGYWSKTKHRLGPLYVYQVNMWNGKLAYQNIKKNALVWPVRYAE